jgi:hypothetical protein
MQGGLLALKGKKAAGLQNWELAGLHSVFSLPLPSTLLTRAPCISPYPAQLTLVPRLLQDIAASQEKRFIFITDTQETTLKWEWSLSVPVSNLQVCCSEIFCFQVMESQHN